MLSDPYRKPTQVGGDVYKRQGLARRIVNGDVPESMRNKRIVSLNICLLYTSRCV